MNKDMVEYATFIRSLTDEEYVTYLKANLIGMPESIEDYINPKVLYAIGTAGLVIGVGLGYRALRIMYAKNL